MYAACIFAAASLVIVFVRLLTEGVSKHLAFSDTIGGGQGQEQRCRLPQENARTLQGSVRASDLVPADAGLPRRAGSSARCRVHPHHEPIHRLQRRLRICHHLLLELLQEYFFGQRQHRGCR